jgi:peroxiredoxin
LSAVGQSEQQILDLGYQVIGISPDAPSEIKNTEEKEKLTYDIYSDANGALMKAMGVAFKAPERYAQKLLDYSDGANQGLLPVPSIFVVNTEGTILFTYISPDYKHRISSEMLLDVLKNLKS